VSSVVSNKIKALLLSGGVDLDTDGIKAMLVTSAHTPNADDNFVSTYTASELSGTGYAGGFAGSGRKALASKTVTQDNVNDLAYLDADDLVWTGISAGTAAALVLYKPVNDDTDSPIIAVFQFSVAIATKSSELTVSWNVAGILKAA